LVILNLLNALGEVALSVSLAGLQNEGLIDVIIPMIGSRHADLIPEIDAYEDPLAMAAALNAVVKKLYRESRDITNMIAAGDLGVAYCLRKAALESDSNKIIELKKLGQIIAFNTAVNCWPGWADSGAVIEEAHIRAAIELAVRSRDLVQELALPARAQGGAHWLLGALELAAGRFDVARGAFEQAEQAFLIDDAIFAYTLMARGYVALARKADPRSRLEGADMLRSALESLRAEGSKDAAFFADQLATADRVLIGNLTQPHGRPSRQRESGQ
jgi:hypothetical protein